MKKVWSMLFMVVVMASPMATGLLAEGVAEQGSHYYQFEIAVQESTAAPWGVTPWYLVPLWLLILSSLLWLYRIVRVPKESEHII